MKKTNKTLSALAISLAAGSMSVSAATVVAGWDSWDSTTAPSSTVTAAGITASATASASTGSWSNADSGGDPGRGSSVDTTWGTFDGNGNAASAVTNVGVANLTVTNGRPSAELTLTITNGGPVDMDLAAFHMDVVAFRPNAPRTYSLNVLAGSDISIGTVFASAGTPMNDNSTNDITHIGGALGTGHDVHEDLDIDLSGLADNTLSVGETAIIQIAFSNGTGSGGGHHLFLDNVAISGDAVVVPEPSSFLLLGLSMLALLGRRRK
ncbi:MAG: PEP-CTERM sorting domain-containing protein [Akkermansiaceae bacterium]